MPLPSKVVDRLSRDLTKALIREIAALQPADEDRRVRTRHLIDMLERQYADQHNITVAPGDERHHPLTSPSLVATRR